MTFTALAATSDFICYKNKTSVLMTLLRFDNCIQSKNELTKPISRQNIESVYTVHNTFERKGTFHMVDYLLLSSTTLDETKHYAGLEIKLLR